MEKHQQQTPAIELGPGQLPLAAQPRRHPHRRFRGGKLLLLALVTLVVLGYPFIIWPGTYKASHVPLHAQETLSKCRNLNVRPAPPPDFNFRTENDRYVPGTPAQLIKNATIWTGRNQGLEIVKGDILIDKGLIKDIGRISHAQLEQYDELEVYDAHGSFVSPGIFDMHSHLGVYSAPALSGASDGNSLHGPILPYLRSLDGLNTHDDAYKLSISGGVTSAVVLPGSANAIGGQAFGIKLRPTAERSAYAMLLEPPFTINGSAVDPSLPPRWRHMKHACGENPSRVYGNTRMDNVWALRSWYNKAKQLKEKQDAYCAAATAGEWDGLGEFPDDLALEALVDTLRGKVKVHNHCYETVDLNSMILLTQEFQFPIAAFHHAHETYLITDQLKTAYGGAPAAAVFATNARYKRESYRGSEFAPAILDKEDIRVVLKSDHPVINSRHLIFEAQQAHYYGLPENVALAAVTTTPAEVAGYDHRIGYIKKGYDADIVVWDSNPLALGATPKQVWIDGVPQLSKPTVVHKPDFLQKAPKTPDWTKEAAEALQYEGLSPLKPRSKTGVVVFTNVSEIFVPDNDHKVRQIFSANGVGPGVAMVRAGRLVCTGIETACAQSYAGEDAEFVDLEGGSISPSAIAFGSPLGLGEIAGEISTQDGPAYDPLTNLVPEIAGGSGALDRAVDGLQFQTRDALLAYVRGGVSAGLSTPSGGRGPSFIRGLSTLFSTGAAHKLEKGAVLQEDVALHVAITHAGVPSVSTQIATLRHLLSGNGKGDLGEAFKKIVAGNLTLAVHTDSADIISTLLRLKKEITSRAGSALHLTIVGGLEAHLLAPELAHAKVGVILNPSRPFPGTWEGRRILPGAPLTEKSAVGVLHDAGVTVAIGVPEAWEARNVRLEAAWAALNLGQKISKREALSLVSTNVAKLLGVSSSISFDLVAQTHGDSLFEGKPVGMISTARALVDLL